ncbi:MAG TPA: type II toxin-antitoxin system VapC family toxin, partial [Chloroflexia bacterium]|nr:type II toxin-antitoxin system VapC family toxin [Chloroflexia bacterium]
HLVSTPAGQALGPVPGPVVIDASVWIAFFLPVDIAHQDSYTWVDKHTASGGSLISPLILLTEVAAAISRRLGKPEVARKAVDAISNLNLMRIVPLDPDLMEEATNLAASYGLRAADAIYVATAKQLGIPLLTWDNEQLTRPAGTISAVRPS